MTCMHVFVSWWECSIIGTNVTSTANKETTQWHSQPWLAQELLFHSVQGCCFPLGCSRLCGSSFEHYCWPQCDWLQQQKEPTTHTTLISCDETLHGTTFFSIYTRESNLHRSNVPCRYLQTDVTHSLHTCVTHVCDFRRYSLLAYITAVTPCIHNITHFLHTWWPPVMVSS